MLSPTVIQIFTIVLFISTCSAQQSRNKTGLDAVREKRILNAIFQSENYDKRIRPRADDGQTSVDISIYIRNGNIDDINMEFKSDITLNHMWNDKRLKFANENDAASAVRLENADEIWTPDMFFPDMKMGQVSSIVKPNIKVLIYPNGDIHYSTRMSLSLLCPMNLKNFPFDTQTCSITLGSFGFTSEEITLSWSKENPVSIGIGSELPRYQLLKYVVRYCTSKESSGDTDSCLKIELQFEREFHHYLIHIYLPYIMLTTLSWVSFWLDRKVLTARVLVVITTLLTMAVKTYWINESLPPVPYTKALDVWTNGCLVFVFVAILVLATVNYLSRTKSGSSQEDDENKADELELETLGNGQEHFEKKSAEKSNNLKNKTQTSTRNIQDKLFNKCPQVFECITYFSRPHPSCAKKIDAIAKFCFPLSFLIFNLCYWVTYSSKE